MNIKKLVIKNIGIISNEAIEFNKPLNLFYGDVRQGKTTILNAIKWCFGGKFPDDIIKHGKKKALIELYFDDSFISRKFYRDKHGIIKAEKIEFINSDGEEVEKPVAAIEKFLNPFILNQNHLFDMNEPGRKRFFVDLFGVDTSTIDKELKAKEQRSKDLRIAIKAYGEVQYKKIDRVDVNNLQKEKDILIANHETEFDRINVLNEKTRKRIDEKERGKREIVKLQVKIEEIQTWLENFIPGKIVDMPLMPNIAGIDSKISEAKEQNVRHEQYQKDRTQATLKAQDQDELTENEEQVRELRQNKASLLSTINDKCSIRGLVFDNNGDFEYEDTSAGMLSTSQLMRLSSELGKLYPDGMGLELIDRGESIGKNIFTYVDRAKTEDLTILATIVGEKPAKIPENIGVFVVENGLINGE